MSLEPHKWYEKDAVLDAFSASDAEFENVMAMASVGWAFCQIHAFEQLVSGILLTANSVKVGKKARNADLDLAATILSTHSIVRSSTLGQLVGYLQSAGITSRDAAYLRALVELRNLFVHKFTSAVPLPGDWKKHGFDAVSFSDFPRRVGRKFLYAQHFLVRILVASNILKSIQFGDSFLLSDFNSDFI